MCVNPLPDSWWLSRTFPFTSITHDPASHDSLSGVDGARGIGDPLGFHAALSPGYAHRPFFDPCLVQMPSSPLKVQTRPAEAQLSWSFRFVLSVGPGSPGFPTLFLQI